MGTFASNALAMTKMTTKPAHLLVPVGSVQQIQPCMETSVFRKNVIFMN